MWACVCVCALSTHLQRGGLGVGLPRTHIDISTIHYVLNVHTHTHAESRCAPGGMYSTHTYTQRRSLIDRLCDVQAERALERERDVKTSTTTTSTTFCARAALFARAHTHTHTQTHVRKRHNNAQIHCFRIKLKPRRKEIIETCRRALRPEAARIIVGDGTGGVIVPVTDRSLVCEHACASVPITKPVTQRGCAAPLRMSTWWRTRMRCADTFGLLRKSLVNATKPICTYIGRLISSGQQLWRLIWILVCV